MSSSAENVKLGVCNVLFDGVDLGYTKGGVEVEVATSTHEVTVDQHGETPIGELITGRTVSASVPLAETTLENLLAVMPGSQLVSDGAKAQGTVTFATAAPANGDSVTVGTTTFTFRTNPAAATDLPIATTIASAATVLAAAISSAPIPFVGKAEGPVVTVEAKSSGVAGNVALARTGANITVTALTGGKNPTKAKVVVSNGININLLSVAKTLVLRPRGTTGEDDFTIHRAACPGALSFNYTHDQERVYSASFKGYVLEDGTLFSVGDVTATNG